MKISKGIPDDTPENTVRAIFDIIMEEAKPLRAEVDGPEWAEVNLSRVVHVKVTCGQRYFAVWLSFIPEAGLRRSAGSIGNGYIEVGTTSSRGGIADLRRTYLELLSVDHPLGVSSPFRWGLFGPNADRVFGQPSQFLDAETLRQSLQN